MKVYGKVVLNNSFVYAETSDANLVYELHPKPLTHQRERVRSKTQPRYFSFAYSLISVPLYTMFKALVFRSLCLVPNKIHLVLS